MTAHRGSAGGAPCYSLPIADLARLVGRPVAALRGELRDLGIAADDDRLHRVAPRIVRAYLERLGYAYRSRSFATVNLRGGVGKTTCCITVASRAAQYGFKTCILDLDPQGSASLAFDRVPAEDAPIFLDVWQKPTEMVAGSLVQVEEFLHLLPSSLENGLLDVSLSNPAAQKNAVRGVCTALFEQGFDLVAIDCPPSLGAAVISTICAAELLIMPVWSDAFSFKGIDLTLGEVRSICETFHLDPPQVRVLFSKLDRRERLATEALAKLRSAHGERFFPVPIRTSSELSKALARKETIFARGARFPAREDYEHFVRSLLGLTGFEGQEEPAHAGRQPDGARRS